MQNNSDVESVESVENAKQFQFATPSAKWLNLEKKSLFIQYLQERQLPSIRVRTLTKINKIWNKADLQRELERQIVEEDQMDLEYLDIEEANAELIENMCEICCFGVHPTNDETGVFLFFEDSSTPIVEPGKLYTIIGELKFMEKFSMEVVFVEIIRKESEVDDFILKTFDRLHSQVIQQISQNGKTKLF